MEAIKEKLNEKYQDLLGLTRVPADSLKKEKIIFIHKVPFKEPKLCKYFVHNGYFTR